MVELERDELLVAKWLYDRKYYSALVAFEADADIQLHEATSQIKLVKKICLEGDFHGLQILMDKMFTDPHLSLFRFSIARHELLERLSSIKSRSDVQRFVCDLEASKSIIGSELVSQIESALSMPDPMRHELYDGWSKIKGRYELFEAMLPVLRRIFPDQSYEVRLSDSCPSNPLSKILSHYRKSCPAEFDSFFHGPKFSTPIESPAPIAVHVEPAIVPTKPPTSPPAPIIEPQSIPFNLASFSSYFPAHRYKDVSNSPVRVACFSSDGKRLAIGTNSQSLVICDIRPGSPDLAVSRRLEKLHAGSVYSIAWSPNLIATGSNDQTIKLTPDDSSTRPGARIKLQAGTVRGLDFHTDNQSLFAGCSGDCIVRQLDPIKGTVVAKFSTCQSSLNDTSFINTVSVSNNIVVCALSNGSVVGIDDRCTSAVWRISSGNNTSAVANCRGTYVAVGTESGNVGLYDIRSTDPLWSVKNGHNGACRSVSISHTANPIIASASFDKRLKLWNNGQILSTLEGQHTDRIVHVQWSVNDSIVSCGTDSSVFVWESQGEKDEKRL